MASEGDVLESVTGDEDVDAFSSVVLRPCPNSVAESSDYHQNSDESNDNDPETREVDTDPQTQQRRIRIIRKLLAEFNLESTIDRYRSLQPMEYRMEESDFSLGSASANSRVKQRLERLMGTDIVKLNDKKYMQKLEKSLQQEYEAAMNKKEVERMCMEQMRMRRLAVQGLTSDDYDDMGNPKNRKADRRKRKKLAFEGDYTDSCEDVNNLLKEGRKPAHHSRYQDVKGDNRRSQREKQVHIAIEPNEGPSRGRSALEDKRDTNEEMFKSPRTPREKYQSPLVKEMQQEETVAGLYKIAQRIVL